LIKIYVSNSHLKTTEVTVRGDLEVVKRSHRDESIWVVIHMCIEAMLGISLYSYLYLKLAKTLSFLLSLMFSLQQSQRTRGYVCVCGPNNVYTRAVHFACFPVALTNAVYLYNLQNRSLVNVAFIQLWNPQN
jgi:hypothetical protein